MTGAMTSVWAAVQGALERLSLAFKITFVSVAITVGALCATLALFAIQDYQVSRAEFVRSQLSNARVLAAAAQQVTASGDPTANAKAQTIFEQDEDAVSAAYVSADGRRLSMARHDGVVGLAAPGAADEPTVWRDGRLECRASAMVSGRKAGDIVLVASADRIWRGLVRNLLVGLALAVAGATAAGLAARRLVKRALRPLSALDAAMTAVSQTKDFSVVVPQVSQDEVGRITGDFNQLIAELGTYDARVKRAMADLTIARDAAEEANIAKSQFLANMSHEIRTPLNGVMGMAQVMALGALDEEQRERLEVIRQSGAALLTVLNDLLDLSKIEAGRMELESAPFDIEEVAKGACATFGAVASGAGVDFVLNVAEPARGRWEGDAMRVRQVIANLVSNALKFTKQGGVTVSIAVAERVSGRSLTISVADTGIGIAPDALPKLFQKFVQADASTTRRFGGTGLGLTICRHLAELMGGSIEVQSKLGVGTTFRVSLPLKQLAAADPAEPAAAHPAPEPEAAVSLDGLRVLAAEDNATNQVVLRTILNSLGVDPVIVADGEAAVEAWATEAFDLVLMDVQMPVMDGVAAAQEIRRREAAAGRPATPIIALSANAMKHQVAEYLAAGMDAHLAKPIQLERLYAALAAVAAGEHVSASEAVAA